MLKFQANNLSENFIICKKLEIKGIRQYNKNGELFYNIDNIIKICKEKENDSFIKYIGLILNEPRTDLIKIFFINFGKDFLINKLLKTCEIENKGGMKKKLINNNSKEIFERKSPGGVFLNLIKNDEESKNLFKKIIKKDLKEKRERKKIYKSLEKLEI